jgi:isoleucyl-tRNA synthetase
VLTGAIRKQARRTTRADARAASARVVRCAGQCGAHSGQRGQCGARGTRGTRAGQRGGLLMTRHAAERRHDRAELDLPGIDRAVLASWDAARWDTARRDYPGQPGQLPENAGRHGWTCCTEPLAAAGLPGVHDVPAQVVADCYRRLKTMQGFDVGGGTAIAGHGLAIEVAVERELGLSSRSDIESYGSDRFAARCRESAARHGAAFAALTARLGCRPTGQPGATTDPRFIESAWWSLRRCFDAGLLRREDRVTPYCPRCQTPLSSYDLGPPEARSAAEGAGVMVRFGLATLPDGANPRLRGADLLGWTTRPWALAANPAIAVHPHNTYAMARRSGHEDRVIVAESRLAAMLGEHWHVAARFSGAELAGATYHPPRGLPGDISQKPVVACYWVPARAGTGLVPLAPAFGADDLAAAREHALAVEDPVGPDGRFDARMPLLGGVFFADASKLVLTALSDAGSLFPPAADTGGGARCRRCGTPLLTRLMPAWYLHQPGSGEDDTGWLISRSRFWGTPLPLWECASGHLTCVESRVQLAELAGTDVADIDPHRPLIDEVMITCARCGGLASRVPDVLDARFEAGWLPFASAALPGTTVSSLANKARDGLIIATASPSSGWQEAVRDVGTAVYGRPPDSPALVLGSVSDASGRAMSREEGNVVEPLALTGRFGADVIRWFCLARPTGDGGRLTDAALAEITATVFAPYWRAATALAGAATAADAPPPAARPAADQEILRERARLAGDVAAAFEELTPESACARLAAFIGGLANRYLPEAELRLAPGGHDEADRAAAAATIGECLDVLTRLMAPVTPFIAEEVWTRLNALKGRPGEHGSVHLAAWPAEPAVTAP